MVFDQARILSEHGHEVVPFAAADAEDFNSPYSKYFPSAARTQRTPFREIPYTLWRPAAGRSLRQLLNDEQFDIVHLHSWYKRLSPAILPVLKRSGLPIVQTLHEYRTVCSRSTMFRQGRICLKCADGKRLPAIRHRCNGTLAKSIASVIEMSLADQAGYKSLVSRFLPVSNYQQGLLGRMGIPISQMQTLPNPVGIRTMSPPSAVQNGPVLFVGRLETYKGVELFADLARMRPQLKFAMAGDGNARDAISAAKLPNLTLLGHLDSETLDHVLLTARCVVIPSLWPEAFGLTAVEAMATGTPVIASNTGGLSEIIRDGIDGLLAQPGDLDSFVEALDLLVGDTKLATEMGKHGYDRARSDFSERRYYERLSNIYTEVLDGNVQH